MTASSIDRPAPELITVDVTALGPDVRVTAAGEIDSTSAPVLRDRLEALLDAGVEQLTIDLTAVTFLDSAGLCVLASVHRRACAEERRVRVLASTRAVIRPLQITGLLDLMKVEQVSPGSDGLA